MWLCLVSSRCRSSSYFNIKTESPLSKYCTVRPRYDSTKSKVDLWVKCTGMKLLSDHVLQQQWNRVENTEDGKEPLIVFFIAIISHLLLAYAALLILRHLFYDDFLKKPQRQT